MQGFVQSALQFGNSIIFLFEAFMEHIVLFDGFVEFSLGAFEDVLALSFLILQLA